MNQAIVSLVVLDNVALVSSKQSLSSQQNSQNCFTKAQKNKQVFSIQLAQLFKTTANFRTELVTSLQNF